jgi:hypothetical protein
LIPDPPTIRDVHERDWPEILEVANASVAHLPGAGTQEEWHANRRHFDASQGTQQHYVAEDPETLAVVGYGGVEATPEYRLFLVTRPEQLPTVGELLYERAIGVLADTGAERVWLREYSADRALLSFAKAHGFGDERRFALPDGQQASTLVKSLSD